jgi:MerR family mercuric resistance operon transcriptional regulator
LTDGGNYTCAEVETLAREHVQHIRKKIGDLKKLKTVLEGMISQCSGGKIPECPIIDTLFDLRTLPRPLTTTTGWSR